MGTTYTEETTKHWDTRKDDGSGTSQTFHSETDADGNTSTTNIISYYGEGGEYLGTSAETRNTDADGEPTGGSYFTFNEDGKTSETHTEEDGSKTKTIINDDGTKTVIKYDADGKEVSRETTPATTEDDAKDPKQGDDDFWDPDIIYGDVEDGYADSGDFSTWGKNGAGNVDGAMLVEAMSPEAAEAIVDTFDFLM